eukprot:1375588-Amorphochlora_amoeboformis.AAC.1
MPSQSNPTQDGDRFVGKWVNDKVCGEGKLFYANGNLYEGEWVDDMRHGTDRALESERARKSKRACKSWRGVREHEPAREASAEQ